MNGADPSDRGQRPLRVDSRRSLVKMLLLLARNTTVTQDAPHIHLPPRLLIDQHILLPFTRLLVGAMNAAYPTAWALLTFEKFFNRSFDPFFTSRFLFGVFNPTNKFVAGDRCQAFPDGANFFCFGQRADQVSR
jgi:hypothetical protein